VDRPFRLGRSLQDLVKFFSEIHSLKMDLYLHQQGLDTTTPAGKAMFQMMGVFAEFERAMSGKSLPDPYQRRLSHARILEYATACDLALRPRAAVRCRGHLDARGEPPRNRAISVVGGTPKNYAPFEYFAV
jgi:hypothetical protein